MGLNQRASNFRRPFLVREFYISKKIRFTCFQAKVDLTNLNHVLCSVLDQTNDDGLRKLALKQRTNISDSIANTCSQQVAKALEIDD